ncbi:DNA/RNA non-specific endonuclease family protein [Asticcacaulis biprosthecium C19]|uniref:DNA/RNA non-specific endonuclease family protein n=1 Tax=Asticcacaulis biprosthecium C19 TaxID=715226 RepID=F4QS68_9CAUL|nr:DNA/RNA non-specific endonuclease [Asticcacaulis biprosthecium]EGF89588.1 DNA/RNA non-specific endonuclease family protein [Asticcacaulis biprosthecium C19]
MDYTTLHPMSAGQVHLVDLHLWRGPPKNLDSSRPVQIMVNQGYVVGFCPARLQPAWSAYRVASATRDVDFDRPIHYHDDLRLPEEHRIGRKTFGKLGNIGLEVGHMTPNEVINRQFGRLAQMETFLMSNMSPQYGSLNGGVWLKLETAIREIKDEPGKDHVWAVVGPVFGDEPALISRGNNKHLPVPKAYFCIMVDPFMYPFDQPSNARIDCFIIPQDAPPASNPQDYPATLAEVEQATNLKFFSDWGRDIPVEASLQIEREVAPSRLIKALEAGAEQWKSQSQVVREAQPEAASIAGLIESLDAEAAALQQVDRSLSQREEARLVTLQHTISWLLAARRVASHASEPETSVLTVNLITYKIEKDLDGRLKEAARIACNFWNRFIEPRFSIVIRLGLFTADSRVIARAYEPYEKDGVRYGVVQFNTKYLATYTPNETAGTIVHEIGHTLGIGWTDWDALFNRNTGLFTSNAVQNLSSLRHMIVELEGGSGTAWSHWDEETFGKELMTGYKNPGEHVLPVTIEVMALFGHKVVETLAGQTGLDLLLDEVANLVFSRQDEIRKIDLEHFEQTKLMEVVPHQPFSAGEA